MRREGRQHGVVRTHVIISPPSDQNSSRLVKNRLESPTTGVFAKVSSKPTNHSKFTGKCCKSMCTTCHLLPAGKAKTKSKGSNKFGLGNDFDEFVVYGDRPRFDDGDDYED